MDDPKKSTAQAVSGLQFKCFNVQGECPTPWEIPISLDDKCTINLTVDSGSPVTIVLFSRVSSIQGKIKPTKAKLTDFSQNEITGKLVGQLTVGGPNNET